MRGSGGLGFWWAWLLGAVAAVATLACAGGGATDEGSPGPEAVVDAGVPDRASPPPPTGRDAGVSDSGQAIADSGSGDANGGGGADTCTVGDGGADAGCYAITCTTTVHTLQDNRDRLIADYAKRRCTDSCTLWAALNQAERYVFLMDTAYLGAPASSLYPPGTNKLETALDHAIALYSINGPKAGQGVDFSGRGGNDYNRIYLGFDALAACVMRDFPIANPTQNPSYNMWVTSDDLAGPHAPFTQREMIFWYKAWYDPQSEGPQFHHWHQDSDFDQNGLNQRLGVCGVTDRTVTELTVAFDMVHNSDPLGDYSGRGGYGWQIVDQYVGVSANWAYMPTGCPTTPPVNTDPYGGGTFNGMGPSLNGSNVCAATPFVDGGC